jgi:hypothetical protein
MMDRRETVLLMGGLLPCVNLQDVRKLQTSAGIRPVSAQSTLRERKLEAEVTCWRVTEMPFQAKCLTPIARIEWAGATDHGR